MSSQETIVEISLNNLEHNLNFLKSNLSPKTMMMAVVKASAYGSDSVIISKYLEKKSIDYFAVAYCREGVYLRKAGIKTPILVLHPQVDDFENILNFNLEPSIYSFRILNFFLNASKSFENHPFQIKFNTGLNRLGFNENDIEKLVLKLNNRSPKFIFSHLGASDDEKKDRTNNQIERFLAISKKFDSLINKPTKKHILNTSGILNFSDFQFDMVRSGIGLYGFGNHIKFQNSLRPVIALKTIISQIHKIQKGEHVGYNKGFKAKNITTIATLPIGHADGISRSYGQGKLRVLVNGNLVPTIGNICMDMLMIDVSKIKCNEGDTVTIFDDKNFTADEMGSLVGTISYEILTSISNRVKRVLK